METRHSPGEPVFLFFISLFVVSRADELNIDGWWMLEKNRAPSG
jgi:hypothetical protein